MATPANDGIMNVTIKQLDGQTYNITIGEHSTVTDLKEAIFQDRAISVERQRLIFRAQELKSDDATLASYGVSNLSTLHIVIRPAVQNNQGDVVVGIPPNDPNQYQQPFMAPEGNIEGEQGEGLPPGHGDVNVMKMVRLCRFVRIFALIDGIFLLLYGLSKPYFFILAAFALAGYWGAKTLQTKYLVLYIICLICEIGLRIYIVYDQQDTVNIILFVLMILIDMFVLKCVIQLYRMIPHLDQQQRDQVLVLNRMGLV